ncbi:unnamed protein product [Allacma fusca]|uniref:Uncharacterized protein n=1 Tax=Allacma fusca TaxID=39272 RepID=A0A8J2JV09_9HEXA|nr:unnamed protein product [Allacma fusca]
MATSQGAGFRNHSGFGRTSSGSALYFAVVKNRASVVQLTSLGRILGESTESSEINTTTSYVAQVGLDPPPNNCGEVDASSK